jgi:hypothetical protein
MSQTNAHTNTHAESTATEVKPRESRSANAAPAPSPSPPAQQRSQVADETTRRTIVTAAIFGAFGTLLWAAFFIVGYAIPTSSHRSYLQDELTKIAVGDFGAQLNKIVEGLLFVGFAYTPMNLIFLCCLASLIGCMGRIVAPGVTSIQQRRAETTSNSNVAFRSTIGAITWGFFVFLLVLSGSMIVFGDPFQASTPAQYMRVACAASALAFVVGWNPGFVQKLVQRVEQGAAGSSTSSTQG